MADQIAAAEQALRQIAEQGRRRTPEQQRHYEWVTRRSTAIQTLGVRPVDGVTFGKGKKDAKR